MVKTQQKEAQINVAVLVGATLMKRFDTVRGRAFPGVKFTRSQAVRAAIEAWTEDLERKAKAP